jgi:hypothetical protein
VLDIDVKGYFDSIDWELYSGRSVVANCPWVLLYIERWLKVPVQMEDGSVVRMAGLLREGRQPHPGRSVSALCVRYVDRGLPAHPVRALRGHAICHCKSADEAQALWALADRFAACKLVLHLKTRSSTQGCPPARNFPNISFDFLGFAFREEDVGKGKITGAHSFQPPPVRHDVDRPDDRRWTLHHRSDKALQELAKMYNPYIQGWINYYGNFYRTQLRPT